MSQALYEARQSSPCLHAHQADTLESQLPGAFFISQCSPCFDSSSFRSPRKPTTVRSRILPSACLPLVDKRPEQGHTRLSGWCRCTRGTRAGQGLVPCRPPPGTQAQTLLTCCFMDTTVLETRLSPELQIYDQFTVSLCGQINGRLGTHAPKFFSQLEIISKHLCVRESVCVWRCQPRGRH